MMTDDLFGYEPPPPNRAFVRKPNRNHHPEPASGIQFTFLAHEYAHLKIREPGPSGTLGGWGRLENKVFYATSKVTLICTLNAEEQSQLTNYIQRAIADPKYRKGGPNHDVLHSCIPALRRVGIDLDPNGIIIRHHS
jgi:hypothetical protein